MIHRPVHLLGQHYIGLDDHSLVAVVVVVLPVYHQSLLVCQERGIAVVLGLVLVLVLGPVLGVLEEELLIVGGPIALVILVELKPVHDHTLGHPTTVQILLRRVKLYKDASPPSAQSM